MKKKIDDLSIFGGPAAFDRVLHVGQPNIGNRERFMDRIDRILDRHWLTNNGTNVQTFERELTAYLGVAHCIPISNGTLALEIAIRALGLKGEVILPSFTFIATAHSLQWQEITPVFCDIDPRTHNIDPEKIENLITPRTTGIVAVHLWGRPCQVEKLEEIAARHRLKLIFDAAHAFGCAHKDKLIGGFGDAEVFSFHATKIINSAEGGAISTNDERLAQKIRLMKNFGFSGLDNVIYIGTNGKMNEICAALGLTSLESLDDFIDINKRNYAAYLENMKDLPGIGLQHYDDGSRHNHQYIVVEVDAKKAGIGRDTLLQVLHAENIRARRYFYPGCHRMEPYRSYYPNAGLLLPQSEKLARRILVLPTGQNVGVEDIQRICQVIRFVTRNGPAINRKLVSVHKW